MAEALDPPETDQALLLHRSIPLRWLEHGLVVSVPDHRPMALACHQAANSSAAEAD
jgi:hypothetical protein